MSTYANFDHIPYWELMIIPAKDKLCETINDFSPLICLFVQAIDLHMYSCKNTLWDNLIYIGIVQKKRLIKLLIFSLGLLIASDNFVLFIVLLA